jgi:metal-sulfur cluster biosynthetic enzyme
MAPIPQWASEALAGVFDPCCSEKGISVMEMGLIRSVEVSDGRARVELLLTTGWCPFAAQVLTDVQRCIEAQPGIEEADVEVVWDEAWTTDRLSERARRILRFLPAPATLRDKDKETYIRENLS